MSQTEMTVQPMHIIGLDDRPVCGATGRFWGDTNWDAADSHWSFRRCKGCEAKLGPDGIERLTREREARRREGRRTEPRTMTTPDDRPAAGTDEPAEPATLLAGNAQLARYSDRTTTRTRIHGRLIEVDTVGTNEAFLLVAHVDGLQPHELVSAHIKRPTEAIDQVLRETGKHGEVTIVGMARLYHEGISTIRIDEVESVNGVAVRP